MFYHILTLEGRGRFPLDMLRYDRCFPHRQEDVSALDAEPGENWKCQVVQYTTTRQHRFTPARWSSFSVGADVLNIQTGKVP